MSELLREQMSAFVDDALPSEETALLLRRLHEDAELTRAFACYHLIGAAMRQEPPGALLVFGDSMFSFPHDTNVAETFPGFLNVRARIACHHSDELTN